MLTYILLEFTPSESGKLARVSSLIFNPLQPSVACHIETSHLVCTANQMTGFYMKCNTELNWVNQGTCLTKISGLHHIFHIHQVLYSEIFTRLSTLHRKGILAKRKKAWWRHHLRQFPFILVADSGSIGENILDTVLDTPHHLKKLLK